jgi:3-deoxy-D-manno-octulosonate 8-phosphate phosphatase (KDO 8-P phosphatase)
MAFDVDGIFTDGSLYYSADGDSIKLFNILDGLGLKLLQKAGIQTAIISGRASPMVEQRFTELKVDFVIQNREDKGQALGELAAKLDFQQKDLGYMGDDFPDLATLDVAGFFASVPNAPYLVQEAAAFVTKSSGGHGAVRELCEFLLEAQGFDALKLYQVESV